MSPPTEQLRIGWFASEFGELQRSPETIAGFADICSSKGVGLNFGALGCGTFWQMTKPLASYVAKCLAQTLAASDIPPKDINHIVFATADSNIRSLDEKTVRDILEGAGLINCVPAMVSLQQCVSSLTALNYACRLFEDSATSSIIVVAFDFILNDSDRIKPFALHGDAVSSCLITRNNSAGLSLLSYAVHLDFEGLLGRDSFESRKQVVETTLREAFKDSGTRLEEIEKFFSTNMYKPLAQFQAVSCGIPRNKLYINTMFDRAHCGNCDWMINLMHYKQHTGFAEGKKYLIQSFAPGFFACGLLQSVG